MIKYMLIKYSMIDVMLNIVTELENFIIFVSCFTDRRSNRQILGD